MTLGTMEQRHIGSLNAWCLVFGCFVFLGQLAVVCFFLLLNKKQQKALSAGLSAGFLERLLLPSGFGRDAP